MPSRAPSRSTTCSRWAPSASQCRAISDGSSPYAVSRAKSPSTRRTHRPPRMSIAGMGVNTAARGDPTKICVDAQAHVGALLGMELCCHHVLARDDGGEVDPVLSLADRD